jgi:hypothetical protein
VTPSGRPGVLKQMSLVGLLAAALLLELLLHRVGSRLLHEDVLVPPRLGLVIDAGGRFLFFFASLLAVVLAAGGFGRFALASSLVPRGARLATAAPATLFLLLAMVGTCVRLRGALAIYLQGSFTALVTLVTLAAVLGRVSRRRRFGLVVLVLPLGLRFAGIFLEAGRSAESGRTMGLYGQLAVVAGGLMLPVCFGVLPRGRRGWFAVLLAAGVLVAALAAQLEDREMVARLGAYAFGIELPLERLVGGLFALSLAAWVWVVVGRVAGPGTSRLVGMGLGLIGLAGYQLHQPGYLAASLTGFLCLAMAGEREQRAMGASPSWRLALGKMAETLGFTEVGEAAGAVRMRGERGGHKVEIRLGQQAGELPQLEIVCGHAPAEEPAPLSLTRLGTDRLGKAEGELVETGDLVFDAAFRVRDARVLTGPDLILTDEIRRDLVEVVEGWLGVWPGQGTCYRVRESHLSARLVAGEGDALVALMALVDLLVDLPQH